MRNHPLAAGTLVTTCILANSAALAATPATERANWTGSVSNNWFDAGNWDTGRKPDRSTKVYIGSGANIILAGGGSTVYEMPEMKGNLTIDGSSDPANGTLTSLTTGVYTTDVYGGKINVVGGALFEGALQPDYGGMLEVSGVNSERRSTAQISRLDLGGWSKTGLVRVLDGGLAEVHGGYIGGNVVVSGVHTTASGQNLRSTLSSDTRYLLNSRPINAVIQDGGLLEVNKVARGASTSKGSTIRVSGVQASGLRSTLKVAGDFYLDRSKLRITDGAFVSAKGFNITHSQKSPSEILIAGSANGMPSTLETQFIRGYSRTVPIQIDGGMLRFTESGEAIIGLLDGSVQFLSRGATISTDNDNFIDLGLDGPGALTKAGTGTLRLDAPSSFSGGVTVAEGTLVLANTKGSATGSGNIVVNSGARLGGTGIMSGMLTNSGTVAPGNSPGTLHVGGDFVQKANGTLEIEIGETDSDQLVVAGKTRLDGTLKLNGNSVAYGDQVTFLKSEGPIRGGFAKVESDSDSLRGNVVIGRDSATVTVAPKSYTQVAANSNQAKLAVALDSWIGSSDAATASVTTQLDALTASQYAPALEAMGASVIASAPVSAVNAAQNRSFLLANQLGSGRLPAGVPYPGDHGWDSWTIASGLFSPGSMTSLGGDGYQGGGLMVGADTPINEMLRGGAFAGYGASSTDFGSLGETDQQDFVIGAYLGWQQKGSYANAAIGGGTVDLDTTRHIAFGSLARSANGDTDGSEFFTMLSGGHDFQHGNWSFGPAAILQYSSVSYDGISESGTGALDLRTSDLNADSLRSLLGARASYRQALQDGYTVIPQARVFWQHEYLDQGTTTTSTLAGAGNPAFSQTLPDGGRDSAFLGIGCGLIAPNGLTGSLNYDVELGRNSDANHTLSGTLNWKF